jgi:serine/threonine protein kinase
MEDVVDVRLVAEGAYGEVYRGKRRRTRELVAIKRMPMRDDEERTSAAREVQFLWQLRHPNVVKFIDVYHSTDGFVYLFMEYVPTNVHILTRHYNGLPPSIVKSLFEQLLLALRYIHSCNVIHRDIKCSNCLVSSSGVLKLCDMGMARRCNVALTARRKPNGGPVYSQQVVTIWYRAPELLMGNDNQTPAIDIWAAGCVLFEMMTGLPLFNIVGDSQVDQFDRILSILGTPGSLSFPGITTCWPLWRRMRPKTQYDNVLRSVCCAGERVFTAECIDLLSELLRYDPRNRLTADQALIHPYFQARPIPENLCLFGAELASITLHSKSKPLNLEGRLRKGLPPVLCVHTAHVCPVQCPTSKPPTFQWSEPLCKRRRTNSTDFIVIDD